MNRVIFPLKPRMRGQKVADLQTALRFLLEQARILPNNAQTRRTLLAELLRELAPRTYGNATRRAVTVFQRERGLEITGAVDEATAGALNALLDELTAQDDDGALLIVQGTVRTYTGASVPGAIVAAFDRDLRREQLLGQTHTDRQGLYRIEYSTRQFSRAEKDRADLVVKILASDGTVLVASPIQFNAPPMASVDLRLPEGALEPGSLFERIAQALPPLLERVQVKDLEENAEHQDLTFLSGETGFEKSFLARFALAHRLVEERLRAEFWFVLLGGSFYQFDESQSLTAQLQFVLEALPSLDANAVRKALTRGLNQKDISKSFQAQIAPWIEAFLQFVARRTVREGTAPAVVKRALEDAGITSVAQQETFARLYNQHKAFTAELLDALTKDRSFTKAEIADLHTSFELTDLTQADFSVIKAIKREFGIRQPKKIRALAARSEQEWVTFVTAKHAAGAITLPVNVGELDDDANVPHAEIYGRTLARQFREAFPTTAFAGGLGRALQNDGTKGLRQASHLHRFLQRHETFELLTTSIDEFLKNSALPDFRPMARDEAFRREVKAVQRVFKLVPTFEATDALLADDVPSAQKIYRMGKSEFVRRYSDRAGFTAESATLAWNRAADTHAAALTILADLKGLEADALPMVLKHNDEALSQFPNWNNLFRTGDLCECEHCRSVLSPAAYFADLLLFLSDRESRTGHGTVKDVLFQRRPDLGFLELNCDNALVSLPYIDVVCEVLEAAIDDLGDNDLELIGFTAIPADPVAAHSAMAQAFSTALNDDDEANPANADKQKIGLGATFTLSQVNPSDPDEWVVHGEAVTYLLKKKPPSLHFFATILSNTKATAAELRAYPQYVNPRVYRLLTEQRFPLKLPFDLFAEEVRAGFQKTTLQRWDLMRTLRGPAAPNNATDGDIGAEYFSISTNQDAASDERRLIVDANTTPSGQQTIWGEGGNDDWLTQINSVDDPRLPRTLMNVKTFLHKTGLDYDELLALLDLPFINPGGTIVIRHLDSSCDTDKKVIQTLSPQRLDRIHRFLRLWRKLAGWKMWELDLVIRQIGHGILNDAFLIHLFYFSQLRTRLGGKATVEQVCALFNDLNTETRFTRLHEKREDALYQNLFLNKRLINPLDPAFQIPPGLDDVPGGQTITDPARLPVVLAALGLSETDLTLLLGLTRASDGSRYIADPPQLTVSNLSFLWRQAWLAKQLKFKTDEWPILLRLFQLDLLQFPDPQAAWEFVENVAYLKATGFSPDELNWLLAADRSAKAAVKEADAARFLAALRKELQNIQAEFHAEDEQRYPVLHEPATDVEGLRTLLSTVLQKLNRDESETRSFLNTLNGLVVLEAAVQGLPEDFTFPVTITGFPNHIPIDYDQERGVLRLTGVMSEDQHTVSLGNDLPEEVIANGSYAAAIDELFQHSQTSGDAFVIADVPVELESGVILPDDRPSLPIRYHSTRQRLSFIGVMTDDERQALITAGNPADVIDELFRIPRLAVKFFDPVFTAPLDVLPPSVDFKAQLSADLATKISYDSEQRLLHFAGIMSVAEQDALNNLVANEQPVDVAYHEAINSVATQPQTIMPPDSRVWVTDAHLDESNGTLASRMADVARAALNYLSVTFAANAVIQQSSAQLGLSEALTRRVMDGFAVMPPLAPDPANVTLLTHLTQHFAPTDFAVDYAALKSTFDGWFWANRVAALLKKWKVSVVDLEALTGLSTAAQLLDVASLPMDDAGAIPPMGRVLQTSRLLRIRDSVPETQITFLEVLENLNSGAYATAAEADPTVTAQGLFAADVELLNEAWTAPQMEGLVGLLDLTFPDDYLLAETWERFRRAFYFLESLNAGASIAASFAATTMGFEEAKSLKELLRAKFGEETWLTLSAEIQDVLRERKRDALAAFLLTRPPTDIPSGKWENTNDLYAYYLLDVEMSSCMLTSRLVQGSGSVQLFVQRCFLGLEPHVVVQTDGDDGDSAWRWWTWMRKYRVWEANRKVFLWPENWIEPELKKDRSPFFKDLENELLQNEINQFTVERAYTNYLEKLDGVAQLEIAGFYQEDDGDNTIIHVFGRTKGAEPHLYYYRRYDYRQWSPWEKVDLDIQGDYLIPAVINRRLFLFWPVFTEIPDETENTKPVRIPSSDDTEAELKPTTKTLKLQMAVSDYRQGKWTPKRISTHFVQSEPYKVEIVKKHYQFSALDRTDVDGRFVIKYEGYSLGWDGTKVEFEGSESGVFEISGCKGEPERLELSSPFRPVLRAEPAAAGDDPVFMKWVELGSMGAPDRGDAPADDFTLENRLGSNEFDYHHLTTLLTLTPSIFRMSPPWQFSYFDRLWLDALEASAFLSQTHGSDIRRHQTVGSWLPFFYNDRKRTFFVLPVYRTRSLLFYYPEIKKIARQLEANYEDQTQRWAAIAIPSFTPQQRREWEQFLSQQFDDLIPPLSEVSPSYTDEQLADYATRWIMRLHHFTLGRLALWFSQFRVFHFKNFYHPFVCDFAKLVYNPLKGIPALLSRETQLKDSGFRFRQHYQPTPLVVRPGTEEFYPKENVDFTPDGAYSSYNWELFFHAPLLIANALSKNQRFEEARDWYHFIFNPLGIEAPGGGSQTSKYWITKPFFETTDQKYIDQRIENLLRMLAGDTSIQGEITKEEIEKQVEDWRTNPFEPHRIANYRTVAYQKTVVMKYLDNLIAWGDYLFRQDSMESINEATQIYILAAEILGERPKKVPPQARPSVESFNELEAQLDVFGNALVEVENLVPVLPGHEADGADQAPLLMLYFCIPHNEKLLGYWDTVADRLFKIRHCMNIEGVVRQLALFEPPIDPGALVKAVAGGMDVSSALSDLNAPLPLYRFNILLQKANEVCNDVKALGGALLSALEKKDAEALSLLRQGQEIQVLEDVRTVREKQFEEANENLEALMKSKELAEIKEKYYNNRDFMNAGEIASTTLNALSIVSHTVGTVSDVLAGVMFMIPDFNVGGSGFGGSPHFAAKTGGTSTGKATERGANGSYNTATILDKNAALAATQAGYVRRQDDWDHQKELATKEIEQIVESIAAAEVRKAIAKKELENHVQQIENAKATDAFMRTKYTNEELYQWQIGQISGVYFQSYKLAYDLAKRAERCFRFELGLQDSSYIQFGYWDSLKKGLLSGEKLQYDLRRLESAYLEENRREFELTKHVSLALLDPLALVKLRETGRCFVNLPEEVFDLDFPGHYFRRVKSVSLTLPCITGPYTTTSCTLRLLKNSIRINTANGDNGYPRNTDDQGVPADDGRFLESNIPVKAIAASTGQNDSGVFELNFRDERYLPFEGAGVISQWSLELFNDLPSNNPDPGSPDFGRPLRQFDYGTISDAILHIKYTSREDAGPFKNGAVTHLREYFAEEGSARSVRMFNLRQEFPNQWHRFLNPGNPADGNVFELEITPNLFRVLDRGKTLTLTTLSLLARCTDPGSYDVVMTPPLPAPPPVGANELTLTSLGQYGGLHVGSHGSVQSPLDIEIVPGERWLLRMTRPDGGNLEVGEVTDMFLVLSYAWG